MRSAAILAVLLLCASTPAECADLRMVRLAIFDDTVARRIAPRAEVWMRELGSVWLERACARLPSGELACAPIDLGMRPVDAPLELFIYADGRKLGPDGRESDEVRVTFKLTRDMCAAGCARDMLRLEISDKEIAVGGSPIHAMHGHFTRTFPRSPKRR